MTDFVPETPAYQQPCPKCGSADISGLFITAYTPTDLQRLTPAIHQDPRLEPVRADCWSTVITARTDCLLHHCQWCGYDWLTDCPPAPSHPYEKVLKDLYDWLYWDDENGCYDEDREWESACDFIEYAADLLRQINFRPKEPDV